MKKNVTQFKLLFKDGTKKIKRLSEPLVTEDIESLREYLMKQYEANEVFLVYDVKDDE